MIARAKLLILVWLTLVGSGRVVATVEPPISFQLIHDTNQWPAAGVPFRLTIEVIPQVAGVLEQVEVQSEEDPNTGEAYWQAVSIPTRAENLLPGVPHRFDVEVVGNVLHQPLRVLYRFEGRRTGREFYLIPYAMGTTQLVDPSLLKSSDAADPNLVTPEPVPAKAPRRHPENIKTKPSDDDLDGSVAKGRTIRCYGQLATLRSGGSFAAVDGATVRVMDEDWDWDQTLASGITDSHGNFDISFWYDDAEAPDIYLEFAAVNSKIDIVYSNVLQPTYEFVTGVYGDFGGTVINFGTRAPSTLEGRVALYALTTLTRGWRWNYARGFGGIDDVDVIFPSGSNASYASGPEEICLGWSRCWDEDALLHEYGHHWVDHFSGGSGSDYCNDRCNDGADCKHCMWCQETAGDAWNEGFPNWLAAAQVASLAADYNPDPLTFANPSIGNLESIGNCTTAMGGNNMPDDPNRTENIFAALLWDIMDGAQDNDTAFDANTFDELALGTNEILYIADTFAPITPQQFLVAFRTAYPQYTQQFWATAKNNGYETDITPPGIVGNLSSPSHAIGVEATDVTIEINWTAASDDVSGIAGYSVALTSAPGTLPDTIREIDNVTSYTTTWLLPGSYWFSIRAVDRAGRWSASAASVGPYVIREPTPPDMTTTVKPSTWDYQLIPRLAANAGESGVTAPSVLVGDSNSYFNLVLYNSGEQSTFLDWWFHSVMLDGVHVWGPFNSPHTTQIGGLSYGYFLNAGPFSVRGGRHALSVFADHTEGYVEDHEEDNRFVKQWAWYSTPSLPAGNKVTRSAPPDPIGGLLSTTFFTSYNCDGFTVAQALNDRFVAAYIVPSNLTDDYDIRLHDYIGDVHTAFGIFNQFGWSTREPGRIDAVLVDVSDNPGSQSWHLGMLNMNGGTGSYDLHYLKSSPLSFGGPVNVNIPADRYMALRDLYLGAGHVESISIVVEVDPAVGPVQVACFDAAFQIGDLHDSAATASTGTTGYAELNVPTNQGGWYAVAFYRDPIDQPIGKTVGPVDITVNLGATPPDLAPKIPTNWYASILPNPTHVLAPNPVGIPSWLTGNVSQTYVHAALQNLGPTASTGVTHAQYLDGVQLSSQNVSGLAPGGSAEFRGTTAEFVRGGRHMLSARIDPGQLVSELSEANNSAARQWVWSPLELQSGELATRAMPPASTGGWGDLGVNTSAPAGLNCDGLRLPLPSFTGTGDGYFHGLAVMPGPASDVDVRLHPLSTGVDDGFDTVVASSGWGIGESDFVVGNFHQLAADIWDVGVVAQTGSENYSLQQLRSIYLASLPNGTYGPFLMQASRFVDLYEVELKAGPLSIGLEGVEPDVDWGFTLHPNNVAYLGKSTAVSQGLAYLDPAGQIDYVTLTVPAAGRYCLSVWKAKSEHLDDARRYRIHFYSGTTDAPATIERTRIASIQPNPFNPRTTIEFELHNPQHVTLTIFDLRGRIVRELIAERRGIGRYREVWDGIDADGHRVATGVYFLRLIAGAVVDERKLVMVK